MEYATCRMYCEQWCVQPVYIEPLAAGSAFGIPNDLQIEIFGKSYQHICLGFGIVCYNHFNNCIIPLLPIQNCGNWRLRQSFHIKTGNSRTIFFKISDGVLNPVCPFFCEANPKSQSVPRICKKLVLKSFNHPKKTKRGFNILNISIQVISSPYYNVYIYIYII